MVAVRYATTEDGVRLAWRRSGQGPTLINVPNLVSRVDPGKAMCEWDEFFERHFDYVRYDLRGTGLSSGPMASPASGEWDADLETIIRAANIEPPYYLMGWSHGTMTAVNHAHRYPERVIGLLTYAATFTGYKLHSNQDIAAINVNLVSVAVERPEHRFMQQFMTSLLPDASESRRSAMADLMRRSFSADAARGFFSAIGDYSVKALLPELQMPLLCLHSRDESTVMSQHSEKLVSMVPDGQLVLLDSANHILGKEDEAWAAFCEAVVAFTGVPRHAPIDFDGMDLTNREQDILQLVCTGKTNKEIAGAIGISEKTVRNHLSRVFDKVGVANRQEAIVRFMGR